MKRIAILSVALMLSTMAATAQTEVGKISLKPMAGITVAELRNVGYVQYGPKVGFSELKRRRFERSKKRKRKVITT